MNTGPDHPSQTEQQQGDSIGELPIPEELVRLLSDPESQRRWQHFEERAPLVLLWLMHNEPTARDRKKVIDSWKAFLQSTEARQPGRPRKMPSPSEAQALYETAISSLKTSLPDRKVFKLDVARAIVLAAMKNPPNSQADEAQVRKLTKQLQNLLTPQAQSMRPSQPAEPIPKLDELPRGFFGLDKT